ncbi:hypothetical protein Glove_157g4 [Diversispora epigaea]|uniref:Uncharacterized protein n=1 Tax=Diversispora epigaea TaxID=1348612 RepID=A0A397IS01_9GLOM|nr:hypothetical protein Glove_157g4 [Diversispora epigaea]
MKKSNCFVLSIFLSIMLSRAFALTRNSDYTGTFPRNDLTIFKFSLCLDIPHFFLHVGCKIENDIFILYTTVGDYKVYSSDAGEDVDGMDAYYIFRRTPSWINGYSGDMFIPSTTTSKWVGTNPFSLTLPYSPLKFPSSGSQITIGATMLYNCSHDNIKQDLVRNFCPWRAAHNYYFRY